MGGPPPTPSPHLSYQFWMTWRSKILGATSDRKNNSMIWTGCNPLTRYQNLKLQHLWIFYFYFFLNVTINSILWSWQLNTHGNHTGTWKKFQPSFSTLWYLYRLGFFNPGKYLAKRTKVGRVYCNGSVSKNSAWLHSCTVRVCQNNPMPAWTHVYASYFTYTHSDTFYTNKRKIEENTKWVFIGNIYICCSTKHTGQILQFL